MTTVERLKDSLSSQWHALIQHPFVVGIGEGTAPHGQFSYFLMQDALYLGDFLSTLAVAAAMAPRREWTETLLRHAQNVTTVEEALHASLLPSFGVSPSRLASAEPGLITAAYTDHLVRTALGRTFPEVIAAVLPCYLSYQEIGLSLQAHYHCPDPLYCEWIEAYAGEEYGLAVDELLSITNSLAIGGEDFERMKGVFARSVGYESLFWSQAAAEGHLLVS